MFTHNFHALVLLVSVLCLPYLSALTCEETETQYVKLDLAKYSVQSAISLTPIRKGKSSCNTRDDYLTNLIAAMDLISESKTVCLLYSETEEHKPENEQPQSQEPIPRDCSDINSTRNGVYTIHPLGSKKPFEVLCDMKSDGGGWTVIQKRVDDKPSHISFYQDWRSYKRGFGRLTDEFWLGNDKIHILTKRGNYSMRFNFITKAGRLRIATYGTFSVGDEESGYALQVGDYSGNATDHMAELNGLKFSTYDRPNDGKNGSMICARNFRSGFWFKNDCSRMNWNGDISNEWNEQGAFWLNENGVKQFMDWQIMEIRRTDA